VSLPFQLLQWAAVVLAAVTAPQDVTMLVDQAGVAVDYVIATTLQ
jgi:hypothetical protein